MTLLPTNSTDEDLINFVRNFVNLLAQEKYVEAFEITYHNPDREMSPELIKALIKGYGFAEPVENNTDPPLRVTHLSNIEKPEPKYQIDFYDIKEDVFPKEIGIIHYDLPIDDDWSDLTAIFDVFELEDGIALSLYDIHVL